MIPVPADVVRESVRLDLIEFLWISDSGVQPVLFLERHYLD